LSGLTIKINLFQQLLSSAALKTQARLYLLTADWVIQFIPNAGVSGIRYGSNWRLLAEYCATKDLSPGCICLNPGLTVEDTPCSRANCSVKRFGQVFRSND
jgi:hypothetical protein